MAKPKPRATNTTVHIRDARPLMCVTDALSLLRALTEGTMAMDEIMEHLDCSRAKVFRLLGELRIQLGVCVDHDASLGGYRVTEWGAINRRWITQSMSDAQIA